jgi:hypothetical protein
VVEPFCSLSVPDNKARAMASVAAIISESSGNGPDNPCRYALPLERRLPATVFGPVLRLALARFAAICLSVAMATTSRGRFRALPNLAFCRPIVIGKVAMLQLGLRARLFSFEIP